MSAPVSPAFNDRAASLGWPLAAAAAAGEVVFRIIVLIFVIFELYYKVHPSLGKPLFVSLSTT